MGVFSAAVATAIDQTATRVVTMQTVFDDTTQQTERNRIARIADFFDAPLSTFGGDLLTWFDAHFPPVKKLGAAPLPGHDRVFWTSRGSYQKWREVVRRRICHTTGVTDAKKELRNRIDGWTPLLGLLDELKKGVGPLHSASVGAIVAFSDMARAAGLNPADLTPDVVPDFLKSLPLMERERAAKALRALARAQVVNQVAEFLPEGFDPAYLIPADRSSLPDTVRAMIAEMVHNVRFDKSTYEDVSESSQPKFGQEASATYEAALIALARTAQDLGCVELETLNRPDNLFRCETRVAVLRAWTDPGNTTRPFSLRTAASYTRIIAQVGKENGLDTSAWEASLKKNTALKEGRATNETMSPKVQRFCEGLIANQKNVRTFLRQHVLYQERAKDILATDEKLTLSQTRRVRQFGTCAAFAAMEIRGAGLRKGSALATQSHGVNPNLFFRNNGQERWYELRVSRKDMKGEYVELPAIRIRDDKYEGFAVLDWYLKSIRPLSNFGNAEYCEQNVCAMSPYLFVAEKSADALDGKLFYRWLTSCSHAIGLRMNPHNYRHGFATLLLARSWSNRGRAAAYLGCSVGVLDTYYAWLDKRQKLEEVQDMLAEALTGK
ncbi:hypothetical protein [Primorskyibacter sp. 2E233]|uniref:hypothetical protein n=1 Tax=Primorskyibacter sp. 2E233 TaxID=3413431 RepID=UPI003BF25BF6